MGNEPTRRVVKLGFSRVPCASPESVIHMALLEASEEEEIVFIAPKHMIDEIKDALNTLIDYIIITGESVESETYRVIVKRRSLRGNSIESATKLTFDRYAAKGV